MTFYVTTSIPYVNAHPHLGHALELVQADVLARHRRRRGDAVRLQSGTDDNSLKNVQAAEAAGEEVDAFVRRHGDSFAALADALHLSYDDFIRTSSDSRHRPGVEALWRAAEASGDLYRRHYEGLYCVGCEDFRTPAELVGGPAEGLVGGPARELNGGPVEGRCPEHGKPPVPVSEQNWFFRLERYAERLRDLYASGRIRILPEQRRNEVLAFIDGGLRDFSVSRSVERAHGWGVPVPGDPTQVMYVWWDALGNYVTALGYGSSSDGADSAFRRWWVESERRVHVIGKGILRFHAVYWPAMLLSAGLPLPTDIYVHDYLTAAGAKLSKSSGGEGDARGSVDPFALVERFGADAVRWWLLAEVPRVGDTDFTVRGLVEAANRDLAGGVGNLVQRVTTMVHKYADGVPPGEHGEHGGHGGHGGHGEHGEHGRQSAGDLVGWLPGRVDAVLEEFDPRTAARAILDAVRETSRYLERTEPWKLAGRDDAALREVLATAIGCCRVIAGELSPFLPELAQRLSVRLEGSPLPVHSPAFARVKLADDVR